MATNVLADAILCFGMTYTRLGTNDIARIGIPFFKNIGVFKLSWIDDTSRS